MLSTLDTCHNNQTIAARILGVDRKTLARHLQRWGIAAHREPAQLKPGSLVAIEGIDGAGVTTQAKHLVDHLNAHGHRAILTAEPSTGPIGALLRKLLGTEAALPADGAMQTLSLLFAADRIDHFHRVVSPALAAGTTVVSDRWYHSSLAYQRSSVERDWILALNRHTRTPDMTIFLEVRPELGLQRRAAAGRPKEFFHDLAMQHAVVAGYSATIEELRLAGERIEVIDGERAEKAVAADVVAAVGA